MKRFPYFFALVLCLLLATSVNAQTKQDYLMNITGITGDAKNNIEAHLKIETQKLPQPISADELAIFNQRVPELVKSAVSPYGYFKASATSHVAAQGKKWQFTIQVTPGPILKISKINLHIAGPGKDDPAFDNLQKNFSLKVGDALVMKNYNDAKAQFYEAAEKSGYLKSDLIQHTINIDIQNYTAEIILDFDTGPQYDIGQINISKNPLSEKFLRKYFPFQEGNAYSTDDIVTLQQNLANSNYFQQVMVMPDLTNLNNQNIPIAVNLEPKKSQQYSFGMGYGTDTGVRGSVGWDWRYVNDKGHHMNSLIKLSQAKNSGQTTYYIPGKNPLQDQYQITAALKQEDTNAGRALTGQLGGAYVTALGNWQQTIALNYQYEDFKIHDEEDHATTHMIIPSINWTKIKADDRIFARNGHRIDLTLRGASEQALSTTSFAQAEVNGKYIYGFASADRLVMRGTLGYTDVKDLDKLPLTLRFTAGGSESVRGYSYQQLGPGRYTAVASAEMQHNFFGKWYGTVFYDTGNAMNDWNTALREAAGVGVMWASPIGPIELTYARTIDNHNPHNKIQFTMGPDF